MPDSINRLFAVYLGGDLVPGRMGEDHEVVFVVAADVPSARSAAKLKWQGEGNAHIDAVRAIDIIDGFVIELAPSELSEHPLVDMTYEAADG